MSSPAYERLDWDSDFFDCEIGRIDLTRVRGESAAGSLEAAIAEEFDCLYVLVPAGERRVIRAVEKAGARLVDIRVTLARPIERDAAPTTGARSVRESLLADLPALVDIAAKSHGDSRFYADHRFPRERCDSLYSRWIANRVEDDPESVLVAELSGEPKGYLSFRPGGRGEGVIDLVAVESEARGQGLGMELTVAALDRMADMGWVSARVVTQGGNTAALRLYGSAGFTLDLVEVWYHLWGDERRS